MRKWFHGPRGRSGPFTQVHEAPALMRREEILDRYNQHVKHCPSCSKVKLCAANQFSTLKQRYDSQQLVGGVACCMTITSTQDSTSIIAVIEASSGNIYCLIWLTKHSCT